METLKRTIENLKQSFMLIPVINQDVRIVAFVKNIEPADLINYALNNGLAKPKVEFDNLVTSVELGSCAIHLESKPVKVEQHWSYAASKPQYPQPIGI